MYRLKNCSWSSVFVVPNDIFEKFLKVSSEIQFKVLILIFKYSLEINAEKFSVFLGISLKDSEEALEFWTRQNVLECENSKEYSLAFPITEIKKLPTRYQKPDAIYVSKRLKEDRNFKALINETEIILGRPLSSNDISTLLMLHDNDGLPIDVILMLVQFSANSGKTNMRYIEKVGISWAEEGIVTHENAEKKIKEISKFGRIWSNFENIIGISHRAPSSKEKEAVWRWFSIWNFSEGLVKEAYERCVDKNGKYVLKYIDSIITRWKNQGITTIEQALSEQSNRFKTVKQKASYNIDEYENYNIFEKMGWDEINNMIKGN